MYIAKILEIKPDSYANGEAFLDVEIGIFKGKDQVAVRKYAVPTDMSEKNIKDMVKKVIDLYNVEAEMAIKDKLKHEKIKLVNDKINKLKGESIS